jgi:hypothetical protein
MENKPIGTQDENPTPEENSKNKVVLPVIAVWLSFSPVVFFFVLFIISIIPGAFELALPPLLLLTVLSPIAGVIIGVISLSRGKKRIDPVGRKLAIIAIVVPLSFVALVLTFSIGAATGLIPLM